MVATRRLQPDIPFLLSRRKENSRIYSQLFRPCWVIIRRRSQQNWKIKFTPCIFNNLQAISNSPASHSANIVCYRAIENQNVPMMFLVAKLPFPRGSGSHSH